MGYEDVKRVTGIGGVFFRSKDPTATNAWYKEHLGVPVGEDGNTSFSWRDDEQPQRRGMTVWAPFAADTDYFGNPSQQCMINYCVENLDALLEELQREGVEIVRQREESEYGKFAWIVDPDGNRVELWEPPPSDN
jgi:predicted enzyme related to lactoylglutathione lyase